MKPNYCFWSVCDGPYAAMMEQCVRTARNYGVFKEFHVLADRPVEGCESYDGCKLDKAEGLFKLHYLKAGMSRLNFDYFVWLDADSIFVRNPVNLLQLLSKSPIHVPLEFNLSTMHTDIVWNGISLATLRDLFRREGIVNQAYLSQSAFWIIHHDAIDSVYELGLRFWHKGKEVGLSLTVSQALGYAMQILCANPEKHLLETNLHVWASDNSGFFQTSLPEEGLSRWRPIIGNQTMQISPAIWHLPKSKKLPLANVPPSVSQLLNTQEEYERHRILDHESQIGSSSEANSSVLTD